MKKILVAAVLLGSVMLMASPTIEKENEEALVHNAKRKEMIDEEREKFENELKIYQLSFIKHFRNLYLYLIW